MGTKEIVTLDNGVEVETTKTGWDKKAIGEAKLPAIMAGWKEGAASHHSIGLGLAIASKEIEGAYLGEFIAENEKGEEVSVPVFDPKVINAAMYEAYVEKYSLDVPKISAATSRVGVQKQIDAIKSGLSDMPEVMELLKTTNPEMYAKIGGL